MTATRHVFQFGYKGPALAGGTMNARDFANALLGCVGLIERTNETLNGAAATVEVGVRSVGPVPPNSYFAEMEIALTASDEAPVKEARTISGLIWGTYPKAAPELPVGPS